MAADHGGTLAMITTAEENTLFLSFLAQDALLWGGERHDAAHNGPWIGLSQLPGSSEPGGGWVWDNGETSSFTYWHSGQPDNYRGDSPAIYWGDNGSIGWADQVNDPISIGYGPVASAAIEVEAAVKALDGTTGDGFIWGGATNNVIKGMNGNGIIFGNGGKDRILGGKGADNLDSGAGSDSRTGGAGADTRTGEVGADHFILLSSADSGTRAAKRDHITDFFAADGDRIDLSAIDAIAGGGHDALPSGAPTASSAPDSCAHISMAAKRGLT